MTPEPKGKPRKAGRALHFVVQKHAASHLHYDFRLELDGVLKSWSVPKGPHLDPDVKRLAMMTEDHPIEYADFEGIIPAGEYGGGTVVVWDRGTWEPLEDPVAGLKKGKLSFVLHGEKLSGAWTIWRTKGNSERDAGRSWLLRKKDDEAAEPGTEIVADRPESVITGRTVEEVARDADQVWRSNRAEKTKPRKKTAKKTAVTKKAEAAITRKRASKKSADSSSPVVAGVRISNADRIVYPEDGITKLEIAQYYELVSDWMLPELIDRPLTLVRCTRVGEDCVFMKHSKVWGRDAIRRITIQEKTKRGEYLVADDLEALVSLAQLGIIELHTWNSRAKDLERPDRVVFDLDPDPSVPWTKITAGARRIREILGEIGLESFVKTTGGKGLHVVAPLIPSADWDQCLAFTRGVAQLIAEEDPETFTTTMSKAMRRKKIFIDVLRNSRGNTAVAAYSLRAKPGAPVSVPIRWEELSRVRADTHTLQNLARRLAKLRHDPWAGYGQVKQRLKGPALKAVNARL